jgi:cation-transporting ATPase E
MKTLLILILAITCISIGSKYFFTTSNMMMYELFISAISSVALTLQPNTERVKGKFIPHVLSRAIPGALTLALGILTLYVIHKTDLADNFGLINADGTDTLNYQALMMIILTFCGLVMLYRVCQPFNVMRFAIFLFALACCVTVISIPLLGNFVFEGWSTVKFTMPQVLLVVIIVQASFPISKYLIKFFDMLNPAEE